MAKDTNTNWFKVDVDSMDSSLKAKWAKLKKAQEEAKEAKEDFETAFLLAARKAERIDKDVHLAFGYRFGGLAIAKVEKTEEKKASKPMFSF